MISKTALGLTAASFAIASVASAQILTDTFDRTVAAPGWGSVDNGSVSGMTGIVPADYLNGDALNTEVDGSQGILANNRIILDYNLAADPSVILAGGVTIQFDAAPGDLQTGREFAGIVLADSNSLEILGGPGAINGGNPDSRFGLAVRNSGTVGFRQFQDDGDSDPNTGAPTLNLVGNPFGGGGVGAVNESVFDQATFDAYVANGAGEFVNPDIYTVEMNVTGDFTAGSVVTITATVDGVPVDFDPSTPGLDAVSTIEWGDNDLRNPDGSTSGVSAPQLYLDFLGFNGPHGYDNLIVSAIPEPTSLGLLSVAGIGLIRRRRA